MYLTNSFGFLRSGRYICAASYYHNQVACIKHFHSCLIFVVGWLMLLYRHIMPSYYFNLLVGKLRHFIIIIMLICLKAL